MSMDAVPTSFIPKRTLDQVERPRRRGINLFVVIASLILLISLVFLGGAFGYKVWLADEINRPCTEVNEGGAISYRSCGLLATVELEERNIDRETILRLQRLDRKFKLSEDLLEKHTTTLPVFGLLEELTLPEISYTNFDFTPTGIVITGRAQSYEDVAIQSDIFGAHKSQIASFIFSDLNLDVGGDVTFQLDMTLGSDFTAYPRPQA